MMKIGDEVTAPGSDQVMTIRELRLFPDRTGIDQALCGWDGGERWIALRVLTLVVEPE
jgi:hypothetical protein